MASTPLGCSETVAGFIFQHVVYKRNFHIDVENSGSTNFIIGFSRQRVVALFASPLGGRRHVVIATGWWLSPARAFFLGAIPLLVGGYLSVIYAVGEASMPPPEAWSKPALKIEGFGTVPLPPGFDRLTRDERDELADQIATSLRPQSWANFLRLW